MIQLSRLPPFGFRSFGLSFPFLFCYYIYISHVVFLLMSSIGEGTIHWLTRLVSRGRPRAFLP